MLHEWGHTVSIVDKNQSRQFPKLFKKADVRSISELRGAINDASLMINLAAEHRDDVRPVNLYEQVNVVGAKNICAIASELGINKIIFTSSVAVYGFTGLETTESGLINPFNEYGRTKFLAEEVYKNWQGELPCERSVVIIRPTVVFGEQNRGNVYNLFRQIASGRFVMVGAGENVKSIAYVGNVAAFIRHCMALKPGIHLFNYADKPDFSMNQLVSEVRNALGRSAHSNIRVPVPVGLAVGRCFDLMPWISGKRFRISSLRIKKFCADSVYGSTVNRFGFEPPFTLGTALRRTIEHEFLERHDGEPLYYSE